MFLRACKDQVANVRFCAIKMLKEMLEKLDSGAVSKVKTALRELISDSDKDVRYFTKKVLNNQSSVLIKCFFIQIWTMRLTHNNGQVNY